MIDPEAVVEQVWQRIVPTDWKIVRGKRRSAFALGVTAAIWTLALIVLLPLLAMAISSLLHASINVAALASATIAGYPALAVAGAAALALPLLVGIVVWVTIARRHAGDPDPVLVLLPNGFVEYVSQRKPIIGIAYAGLATAQPGMRARRRRRSYQPNAQPQNSARTRTWLALLYKDGRAERWMPRANFGPPERLYEIIIKAQSLYDVLYGGGR